MSCYSLFLCERKREQMDEVLVVESEQGEREREKGKEEDKDIQVVTCSDYTQSKSSLAASSNVCDSLCILFYFAIVFCSFFDVMTSSLSLSVCLSSPSFFFLSLTFF